VKGTEPSVLTNRASEEEYSLDAHVNETIVY